MSKPVHYVRRRPGDARRSLVNATQAGGVTLVLGAGVSVSRGLPSWAALVRRLWAGLAPPRAQPAWLFGDDAPPHPLALQIVLEEIEGATAWEHAGRLGVRVDEVEPAAVQRLMVEKVAAALYSAAPVATPDDTLGVLVRLLRREQSRGASRVRRVISFNVDDLLEQEANRDTDSGKAPVLYPVPRGSFHPRYGEGALGRPPINVYHLHGFVPSSRNYKRGAQDVLVFTDAQYWESVASPGSFANRVMSNALQDSRCVFVGMSMTDVNLTRWLGLRFVEFMLDRTSHYAYQGRSPAYAERKAREALGRHYWVCVEGDDPSHFLASHLERRGVTTVRLRAWGRPFAELLDECFP